MSFITNIGELLNQPILNADTYKATHWTFEHPEFTSSYGYIEARKGGAFTEVQWFGLQYILTYYMTQRVTLDMIDEAEGELIAHGVPFHREMWEYIVSEYDGHLPILIKALPEGMIVPQGTVLATVESIDEKCAGLAAYVETQLLRVWAPMTVATRSMRWWRIVNRYLKESGTEESANFKVVDFGARGVTSTESAGILGMAHLVNFQVTDNQMGIRFAKHAYRTNAMPGFSIPATEHSVTTSWGKHFPAAPTRDGEKEFFENILLMHGDSVNPNGGRYPVSVVIDTYDQDAAVRMWLTPASGGGLLEKLKASNMCVVLRPDSGDPVINVIHLLDLVGDLVGFEVNDKGFRVLPDFVRLIQGDGIHEESLKRILQRVVYHLWSVDNINFGSGGGLLVHEMERDTHRVAMKTSEVVIGGITSAVHKEVKTDPTKASKAGRFAVVMPKYSSTLQTMREQDLDTGEHNYLQPVLNTGVLINPATYEEVREIAWNARGN